MKQAVIRYAFLSLGLVVFGITVIWLIKHFERPNLVETTLEKNYTWWLYDRQEQKPTENLVVDFTVESGKTVFIKYFRGEMIPDLVKSGQIKIQTETGQEVFRYDLLAEDFSQEIILPAGKYQMLEEAVLSEDFLNNFRFPEEKEEHQKKRGEADPLSYRLEVWQF